MTFDKKKYNKEYLREQHKLIVKARCEEFRKEIMEDILHFGYAELRKKDITKFRVAKEMHSEGLIRLLNEPHKNGSYYLYGAAK
jgi:hypothetical protein